MTEFVIEDDDYEKARQRLMKDPIIIKMADDIKRNDLPKSHFTHEDGGPTLEFMMRANQQYSRSGGKDGAHIGAIAEALLRLVYG